MTLALVTGANRGIGLELCRQMHARGDSVIVIGSESWLDNTSVDLTKYERLHVMFAAPNFTPLRMARFVDFRRGSLRSC